MTDNQYNYQAMFLLDNQEVRQNGFNAVREQVRTTLEKHGLTPRVLRLWGERKLAYKVGQRHRATYLLGWLEGGSEAVNQAKKDFYLVGPVFRCLFQRAESIPEEELAFGIEEIDDSAVVIPDEVEEAPAAAAAETEKEETEEAKEASKEAGEESAPAGTEESGSAEKAAEAAETEQAPAKPAAEGATEVAAAQEEKE